MGKGTDEFEMDCIVAARSFLRTMIVVDDEAMFGSGLSPSLVGEVVIPDEEVARKAAAEAGPPTKAKLNPLDANELVDAAMSRGIVCSVLRTGMDSEETVRKIAKTAAVADVVCVDWQIHGDAGDKACDLVGAIMEIDNQMNGRMRMIAIYTAEPNAPEVLKVLKRRFPGLNVREERDDGSFRVANDAGLWISYLRKDKGTDAALPGPERTSVADLPERIIEEFSRISPGILSNVALATIGRIRNSAHHTVMRYPPETDGPYLAHRGAIDNFHDTAGYAVGIVLDDLRSQVDRMWIEDEFADERAIGRRIDSSMKEHGVTGVDAEKVKEFITTDGAGLTKAEKKKLPNQTIMSVGVAEGDIQKTCDRFNGLTTVYRHHGNTPPDVPVELGFGTIVMSDDGDFYLCIQPPCDAVRLEEPTSFAFMPLKECEDAKAMPHYVVELKHGAKEETKRLEIVKKGHTRIRSWQFCPDKKRKRVLAQTVSGRRAFTGNVFGEGSGADCRLIWVCELKDLRVARDVQHYVAGKLGRIGIDDFELHRPDFRRS